MPTSTKPVETNEVRQPLNTELAAYKKQIKEYFNSRFEKLNEAARNATNVWDRLDVESHIKEITTIYKELFQGEN